MPEDFLRQILEAARLFPWIRRVDSRVVGRVVRARLWLDSEFVEVYYNAETKSISFAYIQEGERIFGANNMRIGWHVHPFGKTDFHHPSGPLSITQFLQMLEEEFRRRGKLL